MLLKMRHNAICYPGYWQRVFFNSYSDTENSKSKNVKTGVKKISLPNITSSQASAFIERASGFNTFTLNFCQLLESILSILYFIV